MKLHYSLGTIDTDLIIQALLENGITKFEISKTYDQPSFDIDITYVKPITPLHSVQNETVTASLPA